MNAAVRVYEDERLRNLEADAAPLARFGSITARLHGVENPETTWVNIYELFRRKREVDELIPKAVAKEYLRIYEKGQIPPWVEEMTDLRAMRLVVADG